jgi:hypothetical protein
MEFPQRHQKKCSKFQIITASERSRSQCKYTTSAKRMIRVFFKAPFLSLDVVNLQSNRAGSKPNEHEPKDVETLAESICGALASGWIVIALRPLDCSEFCLGRKTVDSENMLPSWQAGSRS